MYFLKANIFAAILSVVSSFSVYPSLPFTALYLFQNLHTHFIFVKIINFGDVHK